MGSTMVSYSFFAHLRHCGPVEGVGVTLKTTYGRIIDSGATDGGGWATLWAQASQYVYVYFMGSRIDGPMTGGGHWEFRLENRRGYEDDDIYMLLIPELVSRER